MVHFNLGAPEDLFRGLSKDEIDQQLLRSFLPADKVVIEQNIPLFTSGGKRILFETGIGSLKMFGPHSGRLPSSLREAGIAPGAIDAIVCAHPTATTGYRYKRCFTTISKAQNYLSENDFNFWTDEKLLGTHLELSVKIARNNLLPVRERILFFKDGQEFLPGVQAMFTPGHTKEHACFILTSGNESVPM